MTEEMRLLITFLGGGGLVGIVTLLVRLGTTWGEKKTEAAHTESKLDEMRAQMLELTAWRTGAVNIFALKGDLQNGIERLHTEFRELSDAVHADFKEFKTESQEARKRVDDSLNTIQVQLVRVRENIASMRKHLDMTPIHGVPIVRTPSSSDLDKSNG
jgi:hypothetical protein